MFQITLSGNTLQYFPILILLLLAYVTLMFVALIDLVNANDYDIRSNNKILWALIILLFQPLGVLMYLFGGHLPKKYR